MLEAEIQAKVLSLYLNDKKSIRDIARIMGVDRKTVKRIIKRKQVILDRQRAARTSLLEPYREHIREMLIKDPTMAASTMLHKRIQFSPQLETDEKIVIPRQAHPMPELPLIPAEFSTKETTEDDRKLSTLDAKKPEAA